MSYRRVTSIFLRCPSFALLLCASNAPIAAQSSGADFFEKKIRPVLAANCYGCHSSKLKSPMGGLTLDTKSGLAKGGGSGAVIVPSKPAESLLLRALSYSDLHLKMPPSGKLPDPVIADFEQWIAAGAVDPRVDTVIQSVAAPAGGIDFDQGRKWWAFQPVQELTAPQLKTIPRLQSKIDAFVLARLEQKGLKPSPESDARTLIRRAYIDLWGLKPGYEEVEAYAHDTSPDRYEKLIDRLLASPHYGERWGRYWLDVVRYGEDANTGTFRPYVYAWRYRDWVIEAFNKDLRYDRFVTLQLAADGLPGTSRDDLRALGFLGVGPLEPKEIRAAKDVLQTTILNDWDERVDLVSRGLLGLSVGCARCHDHKFDPISTKDYYGLVGVFASTSPAIRPLAALDPAVEARFIWIRQRLFDLYVPLNLLVKAPGQHPDESARKIEEYREEMAKLEAEADGWKRLYPELAASAKQLVQRKMDEDADKPVPPEDPKAPFVNGVYDAGLWLDGSHPDVTIMDYRPGAARDLPVFLRGNPASPGDIVKRRFLTVLSKKPGETFEHGSGRLDLAQKIFADAAPLAARVIVNRIWGWHFDKHLVRTPSDFGTRGDPPTHPELLEDLSARFIAHGWSLKWLHREILLSAIYRQSSHPRPEMDEVDPDNLLLWRANPRRLDIEAYRDSLLQSAGLLNLEMYGPSLDAESLDNTRRAVYSRIGRAKMSDLLRQYDFPLPFQHSPARGLTITPLQQLFAMNSPFMEQLSAALGKSVQAEPDAAAKIRALYRKILSRDPLEAELKMAVNYIQDEPIERLAQALLASNEEIFRP